MLPRILVEVHVNDLSMTTLTQRMDGSVRGRLEAPCRRSSEEKPGRGRGGVAEPKSPQLIPVCA